MFGAPGGKAPVTLTPAAVAQLEHAGMEYTMEYATEATAGDETVEQDGVRVLIAPIAVMFLLGTEIDYERGLLESGFKFRNPNVTESCGCGESIKFAEPV